MQEHAEKVRQVEEQLDMRMEEMRSRFQKQYDDLTNSLQQQYCDQSQRFKSEIDELVTLAHLSDNSFSRELSTGSTNC
jgi:hypothetical protein